MWPSILLGATVAVSSLLATHNLSSPAAKQSWKLHVMSCSCHDHSGNVDNNPTCIPMSPTQIDNFEAPRLPYKSADVVPALAAVGSATAESGSATTGSAIGGRCLRNCWLFASLRLTYANKLYSATAGLPYVLNIELCCHSQQLMHARAIASVANVGGNLCVVRRSERAQAS